MSHPTQRWGSKVRQGSDDDGYDYAGSSSREWRTRQQWTPQHQTQPQQRNIPAISSWQGTERQQRWWHRDAVSTVRQSGTRSLKQQQPLRAAEVSTPSATVLSWRKRNEFAEQQRKPPRSSWHTRERDDRASLSAQERFAQQRHAWPTRAWPETHERTATGRARQERMQIQRRPRDWVDTRLSPRPTRHIDEQLPVGVNQSRPWHQAEEHDSNHDSESEVIDFQRDCHQEHRSVAEFVQQREPAEHMFRRATSSGRGTFTSSTRLTVADKRVAARPWATEANARHRSDYNVRFGSTSGSNNGVAVDVIPTQATQNNNCDSSSDCEDSDDLGDDGNRVVHDEIDVRDSRSRLGLVLGKRKAVHASPRNDFDHLSGVAASVKAKGKQHGKVCKVADCTNLVRSRGVCTAHGGGKRCQYPNGCDKRAQGATSLCIAHGGGKRCQYPESCDNCAQGATSFCGAHGGGKRCQHPEGCDNGAAAPTMFCKAHGGGKRCQYLDGCDNGAAAPTMFCKAHGGGKRCQYPDGCDKSAIGQTMFCMAHGGGKRCQYADGCDKGANRSTLFCATHGGGKRCQYPDGCGKSAAGRTLLCIAHGGGRRCQYPDGCDKSARSATLFCTAHGGGKRCQYPGGCDKSAQGATSFCAAHGGGRRCQYPEGCGKGAQGPTLFCMAHGGGKRCIHSSGCNKHVTKRGMCKQHGVAAGLWE